MKIWKGYEVKNVTGMKESSREGTGTEEKCNRSKRNTNGTLLIDSSQNGYKNDHSSILAFFWGSLGSSDTWTPF